jgi:hypothetical protein
MAELRPGWILTAVGGPHSHRSELRSHRRPPAIRPLSICGGGMRRRATGNVDDGEGHNGDGHDVPALFPFCLARRRLGQRARSSWVRGPLVFP